MANAQLRRPSAKERKSEREREGACDQKPSAVSEGRTRTVGRNEGERGSKYGPERMAAMQWHMQESECGGIRKEGR